MFRQDGLCFHTNTHEKVKHKRWQNSILFNCLFTALLTQYYVKKLCISQMYFLSLICNYSGSDAFHAYTRHEWFFPRKFSLASFMIATERFAIPQNYSLRQRKGKQTPTAQSVLESKVFYFNFRVLLLLHVLTWRLKEQLREKGET